MLLWLGPLNVVRGVDPTAYELKLAPGITLHNVFHVSLLEPWTSRKHGVISIYHSLLKKDSRKSGLADSEIHWASKKGQANVQKGTSYRLERTGL